jgi:IclR family acetate operon transcriptional repressor
MASTPKRNPYLVQPILKALKILEAIGEKGHDVTLTEIANGLKLPKTTAFRYLQTLSAAAFLRRCRAFPSSPSPAMPRPATATGPASGPRRPRP